MGRMWSYVGLISRQLSQSLWGVLVRSNFLPVPFLSSFISCFAAFCQGEKGSVIFLSQLASWSFWQNLPRVCSFKPSITMRGGMPSRWNRRNNTSCASPFVFIGKARDQPKLELKIWAHFTAAKNLCSECIMNAKCPCTMCV